MAKAAFAFGILNLLSGLKKTVLARVETVGK
jgi:hypothetical protein